MSLSTREQAEVERSAWRPRNSKSRFPADQAEDRALSEPVSRHRISTGILFSLAGRISGKRVLDFGCGTGEDTIMLAVRGAGG